MLNVPKGTKDLLPQDAYKWHFIENTAREIAAEYNFKEIRTPTFEHTEVFARGVGETTDVVNKEMYTFLDKGGRSITLKPEGTAGVARAFIENGLQGGTLPSKLYYITSCFRYERPQAGRLREFHQFGVELLGASRPEADAEIILLAKNFLDRIGVKNVTLHINSIGCKACRKEYHAALLKYLKSHEEKLCPLCRERMEKNPLRVLDCKNEECKKVTANAPKILDYLCDDCKAHLNQTEKLLKAAGAEYVLDPNIVRGLDYYSRTVFEFVSEEIGAQGTVLGGGRYDGLISSIGGSEVAGIGFAAGIERLLLVLENTGVKIPEERGVTVYFAPMGEAESEKAFILTENLRKKKIVAETDHVGRGIKAQFKYADKIGAKYVGVIGSEEYAKNVVKLKDMASGEEREIPCDEITEFLVSRG